MTVEVDTGEQEPLLPAYGRSTLADLSRQQILHSTGHRFAMICSGRDDAV